MNVRWSEVDWDKMWDDKKATEWCEKLYEKDEWQKIHWFWNATGKGINGLDRGEVERQLEMIYELMEKQEEKCLG